MSALSNSCNGFSFEICSHAQRAGGRFCTKPQILAEKKNSYSDETENSYSHQRTRPAWAKAWEKELIWNPTQCHKPVDICHLGNVPRIALWITRKLFADLCIASVHCVSPRLLIYAFLFRAARRRLCTYTVAVSQAVSSRRHFPNLSVHLWSQI